MKTDAFAKDAMYVILNESIGPLAQPPINNCFKYASYSSKHQSTNIMLSTIDDNVVFVHSQYSCILTSQVSTQYCVRQNYKSQW